jgi:hypothetical protein
MNPGYEGRTDLPESVKAMFRSAVCIAPDMEIICLTILFSEGFSQAKVSRPSTALLSTFHVQQSN